jgi:hypothetical protein
MVEMQNPEQARFRVAGVADSSHALSLDTSVFDLTLYFTE